MCGLLDPDVYSRFAGWLGDHPHTVITQHLLRHGLCRVWLYGEASAPVGAIVQGDGLPGEPSGFGRDPAVLWRLLQQVEGWFCLLVESECAEAVGARFEQELGVHVSYLDDVCHVLDAPPPSLSDPAVRLLTPADLSLLEAAPVELRESCWPSVEALLHEGVVACAVVDGRVAATALSSAHSQRYADVGVYTAEAHRGRGYATTAASLVARRLQERGLTPVWGAGSHNIASLRVAGKLGFREVGRRTYVIADEYREMLDRRR
ncbi:MAG: GNAT family N-acetyltransferase [Chloroflexi bacterium]|nr:GNAT family N-acetyltransferase [Chloroflexota bacterium]